MLSSAEQTRSALQSIVHYILNLQMQLSENRSYSYNLEVDHVPITSCLEVLSCLIPVTPQQFAHTNNVYSLKNDILYLHLML